MTDCGTQFKKISYHSLTARQKELFNFQKIAATLADHGFNCIKLADDWQGADFLAYHVDEITTLKVQLKSRITIDRKYLNKGLFIAFPYKGYWYLIEHDVLVEKARRHTKWLSTASWNNRNGYSSTTINVDLLESLAENRVGPVYGPVLMNDDTS